MDDRSFDALPPAFPAKHKTATLTLHELGRPDVHLDVGVLHLQAGDTLVLSLTGMVSQTMAEKINTTVEELFPGVKALVLINGMKLEGVLRADIDC